MITFKTLNVYGLNEAIFSMRNPMNSWPMSDSYFTDFENESVIDNYICGPKDHALAMRLVNAGSEHCKFRRMINVFVDIFAPLYWWKQFDTYKIGTVCNSCSTMHKIHEKKFTIEQFSFDKENLKDRTFVLAVDSIIDALNCFRASYIFGKNQKDWKAMIELLPESYNQQRTIMLNYEVLSNVYHQRKHHKLDEWHDFCAWIEDLPYSEFILGEKSV